MWINDAGEAMKLLEPPRATTLLGMKASFCSWHFRAGRTSPKVMETSLCGG